MPSRLSDKDYRGIFGSLNNGTATPALRPDHLPYKRNVEHDKQGSITKRRGKGLVARVADAPAVQASWLNLTSIAASADSTFTKAYCVATVTYSTTAGEGDDYNTATYAAACGSGKAATIWAAFHIIDAPVAVHDPAAATLSLASDYNTTYLYGATTDSFAGWYVYCRDPLVQDETGLGQNPDRRKLWDRVDCLAKVSSYDATTSTFTLDRAINSDLSGMRIDIRMPDVNGLAIRAVNLYVGESANAGTSGSLAYDLYLDSSQSPNGPATFTVQGVDTSAKLPPSRRITRTKPTLAAVAATDTNPITGVASTVATGMVGGEYSVRYTWETANADHLDNGSWPDGESFAGRPRPRTTVQETWPSERAFVALRDGYGIDVTLPTRPANAERAVVYAELNAPATTVTYAGITSPSATSTKAFYYNPTGTGSPFALTYSPAAFEAMTGVSEFATSGATDPSYEYVGSVDTQRALSQDDQTFNKFQFKAATPVTSVVGDVTTAETSQCLVIRCAPRQQSGYTSAAGTGQLLKIRQWSGAAWVDLKVLDPTDTTMRTYRLGVSALDGYFDIIGRLAGFEVEYVAIERYSHATRTTTGQLTDSGGYTPTLASLTDARQGYTSTTSYEFRSPIVAQPQGVAPRQDTAGQWPVTIHASYTPEMEAGMVSGEGIIIGCADAVFSQSGSSMSRVYSHDMQSGLTDSTCLDVASHEWSFASIWNRVFFCNEGSTVCNFRFDGVATYPMGLEAPFGALRSPADEGTVTTNPDGTPTGTPAPDARFTITTYWTPDPVTGQPKRVKNGTPVDPYLQFRWQAWDPEGECHFIFDYRDMRFATSVERGLASLFGRANRVFEGVRTKSGVAENTSSYTEDIVKSLTGLSGTNTTSTTNSGTNTTGPASDGSASTTEDPAGTTFAGRYDYYYTTKRIVETPGRGYIVRSPPTKVATVEVTTASRTTITVAVPNDPQVTSVEFSRNLTGTADYFLMGELPMSVDSLDANGNLSWVDETPDERLTTLTSFDTGRPAPAKMMLWFNERLWFVPQFSPGAVGWTNISSPEGFFDPEGWNPENTATPALQRQSPIHALAPYGTAILVHTDDGICIASATGLDEEISFTGTVADAGAVGARAHANFEGSQFCWTRNGPAIVYGTEVKYLGSMIEGTLKDMTWTKAATDRMSITIHRGPGSAQVWLSYSDRVDGRCDRVLVFDLNVGPGFEEDRRLWSDWTEMYCNDFLRGKRKDGTEYTLVGDHWGAIHEYAALATDNGLHVDAEVRTRPIQVGGPGRSGSPRFMYVHGSGRAGDIVNVDVLKDYTGTRSNNRLQRLDMGGTGKSAWGAPSSWGSATAPTTWGEGGTRHTGYREHRMHLGRAFRQAQFVFSQRWEDMPPGSKREQSFELSHFVLSFRGVGHRPVGA